MKSKLLILSSALLFTFVSAYAQEIPDALRLGEPSYGVSARSVAMGNAMTGLAQGYDASYYNPAGLAQSRQSEVEMGLNFLGYNNEATYLGNKNSLSSTQTDLSNLGLVYPFPTIRGSFVIAFGYNHGADFNSALSVSGLNPNSSIIPSLYRDSASADIAFQDYLEANDGTPYVRGNVNQTGKVRTSGGMNHWLAALGFDIAPDFSVGLTLNIVSGKFKYEQNFTESAVPGVPPATYDSTYFQSFVYNSQDNQDINGWNAKIGMLYRMRDMSGNTMARVGATVEFPTVLSITDNYSASGTAMFSSAPTGPYTWSTTNGYGQNETPGPALEYDVTTPFKFSLGVSGGTQQVTAAADIEYVDWTQMRFSKFNVPASSDPSQTLNDKIQNELSATTNVRAGVEVALTNPNYSLLVPYLRAGVAYLPSPYQNSTSDQAQKFLSGGAGVKIQNSVSLDLAYQYGWWDTTSQLYYSSGPYLGQRTSNEKITNTNFIFTFKYNF